MTMNETAALALEHAAIRVEREASELRRYIVEQQDLIAAAREDLARKEAAVEALRNPAAPVAQDGGQR